MRTYRGDVQRLTLFFQECLCESDADFDAIFEVAMREAVAMAECYQFCHRDSSEVIDRECRRIGDGIETRIRDRDERQRGEGRPGPRP